MGSLALQKTNGHSQKTVSVSCYLLLVADGRSGRLRRFGLVDVHVNTYVDSVLSNKELSSIEEFQKEVGELRTSSVDFARLGAGLAAAATYGGINVAAQTGSNAAENNAILFTAVALILVGLEVADVYPTGVDNDKRCIAHCKSR